MQNGYTILKNLHAWSSSLFAYNGDNYGCYNPNAAGDVADQNVIIFLS